MNKNFNEVEKALKKMKGINIRDGSMSSGFGMSHNTRKTLLVDFKDRTILVDLLRDNKIYEKVGCHIQENDWSKRKEKVFNRLLK